MAAVLALSSTAAAEQTDAEKARVLFQRGVDEYKAQRYAEASATLQEAYELDERTEILFAWAQAERLGGHCDKAIPLYRKLTDAISDLGTARLVHDNLARCEQTDATKPPPPPPGEEAGKDTAVATPAAPPAGASRAGSRVDPLAIALVGGGALAFGVSAGLFVASSGAASDADRARTYDDHVELADRASTQRTFAWIAAGAGAAMIGVAVWRLVSSSGEQPPSTTVSVSATPSGSAVWLSGRW